MSSVKTVTATDTDLLASLRAQITATLDPLIAEKRVALLDFPDHPNIGDSLIWLGTVEYLSVRGIDIAYTCDRRTYSPRALEQRAGDAPILLLGGGNFGDLWPQHQEFRERVLTDFPNRRIIQLPQSIHFDDAAREKRARERLRRHRHFTLLVRDRQSLVRAGNLDAEARLCPDMALYLRSRTRRAASRPILWLAREDKEARASGPVPTMVDVHRTDWMRERPTSAIRLHKLFVAQLVGEPWLRRIGGTILNEVQTAAAWDRFERGVRILSSGRVVVTDRLHAHILSVLLGISHVVLDNSYGKVHAFHETWTRPCSFAFASQSAADALSTAARLARY